MNVYIKHMVCLRCKMLVKKILDDLGIAYTKVELGVAELKQTISIQQKTKFKELLTFWGLDLIEDTKGILVEKIKKSIIHMIHDDGAICSVKTSHYLSHYL